MPNWDDPRGPRQGPPRDDRGRDRWRLDPRERRGPERRAFEDEAWRRERYAPRDDRDRVGYSSGEDAGSAGYRDLRGEREDTRRFGGPQITAEYGVEPYLYGGQEYGIEANQEPGGRSPGWGFESRAHSDRDYDPDYLRWRDEQMRAHDRDYADWRRQQHAQYDEQYRQYRSERQRHFGQAFHEWRSQRSAVGGAPDIGVAPGVSGYGDKSGYDPTGAYARPSGGLDPPGHLSADPAMSQTGGSSRGQGAGGGAPSSGDTSPEFGKEPGPVQSAADGDIRRGADDQGDARH